MFKKSKEIIQLKEEIEKLKKSLKIKDDFRFMLEESIPKEQNDRKKYVSDIAGFYTIVFKKKLEHFIGLQMKELALIGRDDKLNDIIRSNINCFRLIDEWCLEKTNEHLGNLEEMRASFDDDKDFISNFKKIYE